MPIKKNTTLRPPFATARAGSTQLATDIRRLLGGAFENRNGVVLFLTVILFSIGPRIDPFGLPGDLRLQDLLVAFAFSWSLVVDAPRLVRGNLLGRGERLLGLAQLLILTWFSFQALNLLLLVQTPNEWVVGVGFSLRYAEIPLFAVLSARLAVRSPNSSKVAVLLGILLGNLLNLLWIGLQLATNSNTTLWAFSPTAPSMYGPGLIGEGGVFGTGHYLTICLSTLLAILLATKPSLIRFLLFPLIVLNLGALVVVESRASLLAAAVILAVTMFTSTLSSALRPKTVLAGATAALIPLVGLYFSNERLRVEPVYSALRQRLLDRYLPTIDAISTEPIMGLGPGMSRFAVRGETHNLYMLLLGDFGLVGLTLGLVAGVVLLHYSLQSLERRGSTSERILAYLVIFIVIFWAVAGLAQDSILPVNSNHLVAVVIGVFFGVREPGVGRKYQFNWPINPLSKTR